MTEHQRRVEATARGILRAFKRRCYSWESMDTETAEYLAKYMLRMGGRAPGDRREPTFRVSCETCELHGTHSEACCACWRATTRTDNWRPMKGAKR